MSDEVIMARVNAFAEELKELGIDDFIFAAGSDNGMLAIQYDGDPRGICFLAMTTLFNAMMEGVTDSMEVNQRGRRADNSEGME
jgi:hypothetical protein